MRGGGGGDLSELLINVNIPKHYFHIYSGESVLVETEIILKQEENATEMHDILIEYAIKENNGAVVTKAIETKGGILRINTIKELQLPSDAKPGMYTFEVKASKGSIVGINSATFEIIEKIPESKNWEQIRDYVTLIMVIFNLMLIVAVFFWMKKVKDKKK